MLPAISEYYKKSITADHVKYNVHSTMIMESEHANTLTFFKAIIGVHHNKLGMRKILPVY